MTERKHPILEYVRDKHRCKIGVMLAYTRYNRVYIGWSKCRVKGEKDKQDKFDRDTGIGIAQGRAEKYFEYPLSSKGYKKGETYRKCISFVAHSMRDDYEYFIGKCVRRYTKNGNKFKLPIWTKEINGISRFT